MSRPQESLDHILRKATQHHESGNLEAAVAGYQVVLGARPDLASVHNNLGNALLSLGRPQDALGAFDSAVALEPEDAILRFNRGNLLRQLGRYDQAILAFEAAINLQPNFAEGYLNLGLTLKDLERYDLALAAFDRVLRLKPGFAAAHNNRGIVLKELGRLEEALTAYDTALSLRPDFAKAHNNRGFVLKDLGRYTDALAACDAALQLQPDLADAYNTRGYVLKDMGRIAEALAACETGLELQPDLVDAHNNRGGLLQALGYQNEAIASYCEAIRIKPDYSLAHNNRLFALHYGERTPSGAIWAAACEFGDKFGKPRFFDQEPFRGKSDGRVHIGYVSGDFHNHPVGYFLESVLKNHDHKKFSVHCYDTQGAQDDLTARLKRHAQVWRSLVGINDAGAAEQIRSDEIDILIDLSGHTAHNRLLVFAQRPAPVQVTWLGYFGTTGLPTIDYILADRYVVTETDEQFFSEKIVRLPHSYLCFTPPTENVGIKPCRSARNFIKFASFNNIAKLSDQTIWLWAQIILRVPNSQLVIRDKALGDATVRQRIIDRFAIQGVVQERLDIKPSLRREEYLESYNDVDISLSPTPFGGGTTTAEALWMGVPVVCLRGGTWVGRISESIIKTVGLRDLVAETEEEYIHIATSLATRADQLHEMRSGLRSRLENSPFCDCPAFTRDLEEAFLGMLDSWRRPCASPPFGQ
ncbi:O-linked N-acetylglucosamine transferase, SPINDLY family protein [Thiorhodovibrio frisius]|uniref:protein O-GlcNAc transferase n=1 Tax=Thiorhodovibrio frisius TaxID=631362 RepID=H8Z5B6_9GAMM|nr:glycosyltransferase family 41 protein [Thiorhodovibrio frisius]EIC20523.1 putative O-linked N-acetylglucosamine transferase, SPINDLY family [Thiorhodovibrio frisius]WPL21267.1 TPR repeat-containing protein YrrB [Thiorhodovibrio frisius]